MKRDAKSWFFLISYVALLFFLTTMAQLGHGPDPAEPAPHALVPRPTE